MKWAIKVFRLFMYIYLYYFIHLFIHYSNKYIKGHDGIWVSGRSPLLYSCRKLFNPVYSVCLSVCRCKCSSMRNALKFYYIRYSLYLSLFKASNEMEPINLPSADWSVRIMLLNPFCPWVPCLFICLLILVIIFFLV